MLRVRMSDAERVTLESAATRDGVNVSTLVRQAIEIISALEPYDVLVAMPSGASGTTWIPARPEWLTPAP